MKRAWLLVFAVLFALTACIVQAKDSGVRFSDLTGEVLVRPDEDRLGWEFAELDMELNVMDHIQTKREATAILSLADMTTFVMKPDSEIVLNTESEKESKIKLLAGKVWVNVKKMVKDGSMDVEMSQAVAGIKGTNITCESNEDGSENRVKVLRGEARVLITATMQTVDVAAGEELVIKPGGKAEKQEISIQTEQKAWEDATSKLGEKIQMNEVPEAIKKISESEAQEIARLKETFQKLLTMEGLTADDAAELQKDAERFIGIVLEDSLILASMRKKVNDALATPGISDSDRAALATMLRDIGTVSASILGYQEEAGKIMRYQFKIGALLEDISAEVEMAVNSLGVVSGEIESILQEVANNPNGKSQDWFMESLETLQQKLIDLEEIADQVPDMLEKNPEDIAAQNLLSQISSLRITIASLMKDLAVVMIDAATITELQQIDDILSDQMVTLQNEITAYGSISNSTADVAERRLQSSLRIMDSYARVRRNYLSAQRLYDSTMRSTQNAKFKTSEQEEIETLWQNISDRFQQLGVVADELQSNIESLESQLRQWLR